MTLTPELLADLRKKAEYWRDVDTSPIGAIGPDDVLTLLDRIAELERVAKAVESITEDVAKHDRGADCPYVTQEDAIELLAIIRKGRGP